MIDEIKEYPIDRAIVITFGDVENAYNKLDHIIEEEGMDPSKVGAKMALAFILGAVGRRVDRK